MVLNVLLMAFISMTLEERAGGLALALQRMWRLYRQTVNSPPRLGAQAPVRAPNCFAEFTNSDVLIAAQNFQALETC